MTTDFALPWRPPKKADLILQDPGGEREQRGRVPLVPTAAHIFLPSVPRRPAGTMFVTRTRPTSICFCSYSPAERVPGARSLGPAQAVLQAPNPARPHYWAAPSAHLLTRPGR